MTKTKSSHDVPSRKPPERTYVVHVAFTRERSLQDRQENTKAALRSPEWRLEEAVSLAAAIDLDVIAAYVCPLVRPRPATLLGKGWVERLAREIKQHHIDLLYVDAKLSPVQQRNLEKTLACKVIDRTALILEIFGQRAQTAEGRLQVELAALQYQKSRLVRSWTHLERQRGGFGFMGGPGESQLELDKRMLNDRMRAIKQELANVQRTRRLQRKARQKIPFPVIALVGYTNAGKSTLFNQLTKAQVFVADLLFATLDPTLRQVTLASDRQVIFSDTVGFISDLPTSLIAAFRATLEEVLEADLLLHVRDISHPETEIQKQDVEHVLTELGLPLDRPLFEVWNKVDRLSAEENVSYKTQAATSNTPTFLISALSGEGCDTLLEAIEQFCQRTSQTYTLAIPLAEGKLFAWLYAHGTVLKREDQEETAHLQVVLSDKERARLEHLFGRLTIGVNLEYP